MKKKSDCNCRRAVQIAGLLLTGAERHAATSYYDKNGPHQQRNRP